MPNLLLSSAQNRKQSGNLLGALLTCGGWLGSSLPLLMPELGGSGGEVSLRSCGQRVLLHLTSVRLV